jgi:hypothetical protein
MKMDMEATKLSTLSISGTRPPSGLSSILALTASFLLGMISLSLLWIPPHTPSFTSTVTTSSTAASTVSTVLPCGSSADEARARGCVFDILSYAWMPEPCFDNTTASEFSAWLLEPGRQPRSWPFFADRGGHTWIADERTLAARTGATTRSYTTQEEHRAHCAFLMRRLHRAFTAGPHAAFRLNSRQRTLAHTMHCSTEVLEGLAGRGGDDEADGPGLASSFDVTFESC